MPELTPIKGTPAYIVDEAGATFAYPTADLAADRFRLEEAGGAVELVRFVVTVPRDAMTWDEVADYACSVGPAT